MQHSHQIAIIGGGIQGAALLWEAAHRGIDAVLLEGSDYASATSANSLKIIHGGLRLLQHADVAGCLAMIREQRVLHRIAPTLTKPLPFVIPTGVPGTAPTAVMAAGLLAYQMLRATEGGIHGQTISLPRSRIVSRRDMQIWFDDTTLPVGNGGLWYDVQASHSERLALAFINSARSRGVSAHNYTRVSRIDRGSDGFELTLRPDRTEGPQSLHCQHVIDARGYGRYQCDNASAVNQHGYIKAVNLVLRRRGPTVARGLPVVDSNIDKRLLFMAPWRNAQVIGTWYFPVQAGTPATALLPTEFAECLRDANHVLQQPLEAADVRHIHIGFLPAGSNSGHDGDQAARLLGKGTVTSRPPDPGRHGFHYRVETTKLTMARALAVATIDRLVHEAGLSATPSRSHNTAVEQELDTRLLSDESITRYCDLLETQGPVDVLPVTIRADIEDSLANEQVLHLADLVRRRLPLGDLQPPTQHLAAAIADEAGRALGWSQERRQQEIQQLYDEYPHRVTAERCNN